MIFQRHLPMGILSRLLDGMLEPRNRLAAEKHLGGCRRCDEQRKAMERVRLELKSLPPLEEHPLQQLERPLFIPVIRPAFPWVGFAAGMMAGLALLMGFFLLRPIPMPMRVVAADESSIQAGLIPASELEAGRPLHAPAPGDVDLEIPGRVFFRLRPGSTVTWQERNRFWILGGRSHVVLNVMRGEVLARTRDGFWGSKLEIHTPTANATVKGTAFSIQVEPGADATTLKVLAGSVFFSPYLENIGVNVRSGQSSHIQGTRMPERPRALLPEERSALLETYRIGRDPRVTLVLGAGPERVEELFDPALLYLGSHDHPEIHFFIRKLVREINAALISGDLASQARNVRSLEIAVREVTDPHVAVPLRLYVGACRARLGDPLKAYIQFRWVAESAPSHPLASLAHAAMGRTAEKDLRNPELARISYERILAQHPKSAEAAAAREFFERHPRPAED